MASRVRKGLAAFGCLVVLAGCGSGTRQAAARSSAPVVPPLALVEPNGEQLRTGQQLISDARSSLTRAASVHLTGTLVQPGFSTPVDVISDRAGNVSGSLGGSGGALQVQYAKAEDAVYVRPTGNAETLVSELGLPQAVASPAADGDSWILDATDAASVMILTSLALPTLATTLLPASLDATPTLASGDVDGTPVVKAGATLHVGGPDGPEQSYTVSVAVTGNVRLVQLSVGAASTVLSVDVETADSPPLPTPVATPNP